jgi:hypothetical protein
MTPPALIYLAMGLIIARISLDGTKTRGWKWLQWLQFLVDAARITLLWPLVLFIEKLSSWLKSGPADQPEAISIPIIQTQEEYSDGKIE